MSFQPNFFWMPRDAGCLTNGEINYDNSARIELKRSHQWFMDVAGPELFSNKKQTIEGVDNRSGLGISHMNVSPWHNTSGFQSVSGQFTDRLFGSEPLRTVNLVDRNLPSVDSGNMNIGQKDFEEQYDNNSSLGLSMSHTIKDPSSHLSFGGIRKVKVNQVRDSNNGMSTPMGNSYSRGDNSTMGIGTLYSKSENNTISLAPSYSNSDENTISMGPTFSKAGVNFFSMGHTFNEGDENFISMSHSYDKGNGNIWSMGQPFDKVDGNFISIGQSYEKGDGNLIPMVPSYNKGQENFISMAAAYNKADENLSLMSSSYIKGDNNIISMGLPYNKMGPAQDKGDSNVLPMGHNYHKGESSTISFGGFHNEPATNPSGSIISSYDLLMSTQNSAQASEEPGHKDLVEENVDPKVNNGPNTNKADENLSSMSSSYNKGDNNIISMGPPYNKMGSAQDKGDSNVLPKGHNYHKGESSTISFGGFHNEPRTNPSGSIISSYDLLMSTQNSAQASEEPGHKDLVEENVDPKVNNGPNTNSKADIIPKNKEPNPAKKVSENTFPSNVKSLLSTGMFDGVPVKYVSWSREKKVKGIIKGAGYLCGCKDCNFSKPLNAYDFERHANCKTKHPNNHIYFENGKTVYAVVQELKSTPQEILFDAIQNVTGSQVNQENFRVWKASYQAATRELQRIYGKDEVVMPSHG